MPSTFESLLIVIFFILPGFVLNKVKNFFIEIEDISQQDILLTSILFSCWNFAIMSSVIDQTLSKKINFFWGSFIIVGVAPFCQGIILGLFQKSKLLYMLASKFKFIGYKSPGKVWTKIFDTREKLWLRVIVKENLIYEGKGSIISADTDNKDLFLTEVKIYDDSNKELKDLSSAKGIYINANDVKVIEIFE